MADSLKAPHRMFWPIQGHCTSEVCTSSLALSSAICNCNIRRLLNPHRRSHHGPQLSHKGQESGRADNSTVQLSARTTSPAHHHQSRAEIELTPCKCELADLCNKRLPNGCRVPIHTNEIWATHATRTCKRQLLDNPFLHNLSLTNLLRAASQRTFLLKPVRNGPRASPTSWRSPETMNNRCKR